MLPTPMVPRLRDLPSRDNHLRDVSESVWVRRREGFSPKVLYEEDRATVRSSRNMATILVLVTGSAIKLCNSMSLVAALLGRVTRDREGDASCSEVGC